MQSASILLKNFVTKVPVIQIRKKSFPTWWHNVRTTMRRRKEELEKVNPPSLRPRSAWINWNYQAELFAFAKRLNEDISGATLQKAFTHKSYLQKEENERKELVESSEQLSLSLEDNSAFVEEGRMLMSDFVWKYLHLAYPALPEEGLRKVHEYLLDEELIAYIASQLGFSDLILAGDFPATNSTLANTFQAVVGAIISDGGVQRAETFVQDFVIPEITGKDILEIWDIPYPMAYLRNSLSKSEKVPEIRLLRETGRNTIFAVYLVGIYVDKELIGQGPGETLKIAEEMASLDALKRIFGLKEFAPPLPFGARTEKVFKKSQ